jgi:nitrogen PTS system EIIA component
MTGNPGFADLVGPEAIVLGLAAATKDDLLAQLVAVAAAGRGAGDGDMSASAILERVRGREALGATGFGQGAAIPHARIPGLAVVTAVVGRLAGGVDYGALDAEPVDVAVLLLSPEGAGADHLKALARVSRVLRDPAALALIRAAADTAGVRAAIGAGQTGVGRQAAA